MKLVATRSNMELQVKADVYENREHFLVIVTDLDTDREVGRLGIASKVDAIDYADDCVANIVKAGTWVPV